MRREKSKTIINLNLYKVFTFRKNTPENFKTIKKLGAYPSYKKEFSCYLRAKCVKIPNSIKSRDRNNSPGDHHHHHHRNRERSTSPFNDRPSRPSYRPRGKFFDKMLIRNLTVQLCFNSINQRNGLFEVR